MIIIKKEKIITILIFIILLIILVVYKFFEKTFISVSSIPISNHVIILDAGHGYPDGGAVANDNETLESDLNLDVVLKLQKYLEASGCTVLLTRSDENGIYDTDSDSIRNKKISDMQNRVKIANNSNAEIFISIHMNKLPQNQYSGWQTFYKNNDEVSKNIALSVQNSLNYFMGKENNRQIKSISDIYLTKNVDIPLILIECGFLSNDEEKELLKSDVYQERIAWCIYAGLIDYFN